MYIPASTYRIQFNSAFPFASAQSIVSYLAELGISDVYASPIFQSRAGSTHGYDVVDPGSINQELGGEEGLRQLVDSLQKKLMGWIQDIVPNHMAYDGQNKMLMDVLESGPDSDYYDSFDVNWNHSYLNIQGRILAPFLGDFYNVCLEQGQIQLKYDESGLSINYYNLKLPLNINTYYPVFTHNLKKFKQKLKKGDPDYIRFLAALYTLRSIPTKVDLLERTDQIAFVKELLWELYSHSTDIHQFVDETIAQFNGIPEDPGSFDLLDRLLTEQYFNLTFWKVGAEEINYRRFFTINELISLRIEDREVFKRTHELIFRLIDQGIFRGLRIDHIDGLYDPGEYLDRLREKAKDAYIVVEKILEADESLRRNWPIQGATGYESLIKINGLFCDGRQEEEFTSVYTSFSRLRDDFENVAEAKKRVILDRNLAGDVDNLSYNLKQIASRHRYANDFTLYSLRKALIEVLVRFPVYRVYVTGNVLNEQEQGYVNVAISQSLEAMPDLANELYFIQKLLLLNYDESLNEDERQEWIHFARRTQQLFGPLMAKGVEDTAFYVYNRLMSLNEVGGDPGCFGTSVESFHIFNQDRALHWPHTLNTLATHDTKRGEDARARISILSEIPEDWKDCLEEWHEANLHFKKKVRRWEYPARNDEYLLYQTLIGSMPFFSGEEPDYYHRDYLQFIQRVKEYLIKAVREAKVHTAWLNNNIEYEEAATQFVEQILLPSDDNDFLPSFVPFQKQIQHLGIFNSLSQTLLKLMVPGIPDIYQGSEFWDLSMVDPDNRRPVDYEQRKVCLQVIRAGLERDPQPLIQQLLATRQDGRIKQFVIYLGLQTRRQYPELFQSGDYQPLQVEGSRQEHVVAFTRTFQGQTILVAVPRLIATLVDVGKDPLGAEVWGDTRLRLPQKTKRTWRNLLTQATLPSQGSLLMADLLDLMPLGLLICDHD
ncbi:MAG: malto-oligosyltrehalose synthase [Synechococcaceae cyanobacterium SM2_3_2]|nr:malto-oligosyltrehalose synthase [Synechococcaceae cyanobacterium SM2_3_2]